MPNGFAFLLRVNLPTASEAREPDVYRDSSKCLLGRGSSSHSFENPLNSSTIFWLDCPTSIK